MQNRIKEARRALKLTQAEFGERIGVKGNTVTGYETGIRCPSEAVITSICREFNISEEWLRTGTGEMFVSLSRDESIAAFMGNILKGEPDFRRRVVSVLSRLDAGQWALLEKIALDLVDEMKKTGP